MFTGLGRDDTGGILWGPWTIDAARKAGVYLDENYRMHDTRRGDVLPEGVKLLEPMSDQEIAALEDWSAERMAGRVVRFSDLRWSEQALLDSALPGHGAQMAPVLGLGMHQGRSVHTPISNAHGFSIEWLRIPAGGRVDWHRLLSAGDQRKTIEWDASVRAQAAAAGWAIDADGCVAPKYFVDRAQR